MPKDRYFLLPNRCTTGFVLAPETSIPKRDKIPVKLFVSSALGLCVLKDWLLLTTYRSTFLMYLPLEQLVLTPISNNSLFKVLAFRPV
jgi:hypothetical protein